jgi:hypothetical protein
LSLRVSVLGWQILMEEAADPVVPAIVMFLKWGQRSERRLELRLIPGAVHRSLYSEDEIRKWSTTRTS